MNENFHSYDCPHNCKACSEHKQDGLYLSAYRRGGCIVCGASDRGNNAYAHNECWNELADDINRFAAFKKLRNDGRLSIY